LLLLNSVLIEWNPEPEAEIFCAGLKVDVPERGRIHIRSDFTGFCTRHGYGECIVSFCRATRKFLDLDVDLDVCIYRWRVIR